MYNLGFIQNAANAVQMAQMNMQNAAMLQNLAQMPQQAQNYYFGGATPYSVAQRQLADSMALGQNQFNNAANLYNAAAGRDMNSQYQGALNSFNSQAQNQLNAFNAALSGGLNSGINTLGAYGSSYGNAANQAFNATKQGLINAGNNAVNFLTGNSNAQQQALSQQGYGAAGALEAQGARGQQQLWGQGADTRNQIAQQGNVAYGQGARDTKQDAALNLAKLYQQAQNMAGGLQNAGNQALQGNQNFSAQNMQAVQNLQALGMQANQNLLNQGMQNNQNLLGWGMQGNQNFVNQGMQDQQAYGNVAGANIRGAGQNLQNRFNTDSDSENMKQFAMLSNPALMGQQQNNYWEALQKSMAAQNAGAANITANSNNVAEQMRKNLSASGINSNAYV